MADFFGKADEWRARAQELRRSAREMQEPEVRASLIALAEADEAHARKLEETAVRFSRFRRFVPVRRFRTARA